MNTTPLAAEMAEQVAERVRKAIINNPADTCIVERTAAEGCVLRVSHARDLIAAQSAIVTIPAIRRVVIRRECDGIKIYAFWAEVA